MVATAFRSAEIVDEVALDQGIVDIGEIEAIRTNVVYIIVVDS